jgi:hypothetical protein
MQTTAIPPAAKNGLAGMRSTREFDLWLQRELCRLHGDVLHEPIPQKLLRALEEAAESRD